MYIYIYRYYCYVHDSMFGYMDVPRNAPICKYTFMMYEWRAVGIWMFEHLRNMMCFHDLWILVNVWLTHLCEYEHEMEQPPPPSMKWNSRHSVRGHQEYVCQMLDSVRCVLTLRHDFSRTLEQVPIDLPGCNAAGMMGFSP